MKNSLTRKLYYSISEVAKITQLQPYTLRAWEREFSCLRPRRLRGKNRSYRARDIGIIILIKRLLYDERYTIKGVSQKLKNEPDLVRQAAENTTFSPANLKPDAALGAQQKEAQKGTSQPARRPDERRGEAAANSAAETREDSTTAPREEVIRDLRRALAIARKELRDALELLR